MKPELLFVYGNPSEVEEPVREDVQQFEAMAKYPPTMWQSPELEGELIKQGSSDSSVLTSS